MKKVLTTLVLLLLLTQPIQAAHWLNDNVVWNLYFKWKAIKIKKEIPLNKDNLSLVLETKPSYISDLSSLVNNPSSIINISSYNITASIVYKF